MSGPPQGPYGSLVLNELHSLFPALLYDRRRFHTVQDVLEYVERQMSGRFDLYSSWRNHFREQNPLPTRAQPRAQTRWGTAPVPPVPEVQVDLGASLGDPLTQLLLRAIMTPGPVPATPPATNPFWEPVVVAPTVQQIARASTVYTAPTRLDTPCTICQDAIGEGDQVRKLTHCNHFFHRNCIDTWFIRHVDCPVCRHDIRTGTTNPLLVTPPQQTMPPA